jgi:hypothetical protein
MLDGAPKASPLAKVQKFVIERWHRRDIKNAPYNPRKIDDYARKKLEKNLRKVGLLEPLIVNRRTQNLVSGHQRLALVDVVQGTDDYVLDVSIVELTDKQEREQNLFMNNYSAQGQFDEDLLKKMFKEGEIDVDATGFDKMDLSMFFGDDPDLAGIFAVETAPAEVQKSVADIEKIQALKQAKREHREKDTAEKDTEFYAVLVFANRDEQTQFMTRCGEDPNGRYVDGRKVHTLLEVAREARG